MDTTNHLPVISVVIPSYNRAATLRRAIGSVLAQTFEDFEVIVVDDGSTDETQTVVAAIQDPRVRYLYQENRGVSAARNAGARAAKGEYLAFLDSDDEVLPQWLERLVAALDEPQTGVVYCGMQVLSDDGFLFRTWRRLRRSWKRQGWVRSYTSLTFAVRTEVFLAVGGYNEALHYGENAELHWRLQDYCAEHGWRCADVQERLGIYHAARTGGARHPRNFARRLASYECLLETHAARFERRPKSYAIHWSLAGVAAARLGQLDKARAYFGQAVHWDRRNLRHRLRLLLTYVPVVRERFWLRQYK